MREVGVELYQEMLKEAVMAARLGEDGAREVDQTWSPVINLGTAVLIPDAYVADLTVRLSLYRRIAAIDTMADMDSLMAEMIDRFGPVPEEVRNLIDTIQIKIPSAGRPMFPVSMPGRKGSASASGIIISAILKH